MLIIDKILFFKVSEMEKLDKKTEKIDGENGTAFWGDFNRVFRGFPPTSAGLRQRRDPLLHIARCHNVGELHRLCHLPREQSQVQARTYGKVLGRMRMGTNTLENREYINTRLIGEKVQLPGVPDVCYACPTNKEHNAITAGVFKNQVVATHPLIESNEKPPQHTLMVEASMRCKQKRISRVLHDLIVTKLGEG